jgi:hypothetical protein
MVGLELDWVPTAIRRGTTVAVVVVVVVAVVVASSFFSKAEAAAASLIFFLIVFLDLVFDFISAGAERVGCNSRGDPGSTGNASPRVLLLVVLVASSVLPLFLLFT